MKENANLLLRTATIDRVVVSGAVVLLTVRSIELTVRMNACSRTLNRQMNDSRK